ncbi:MAG: hypothetical protein L0I76_25595 [Pseudonocardia sp.]|nr:hypothetical protein [Pseudonocardia sp.]
MSSATVATIACLALVATAGLIVWVARQQRRTDELARSLSDRKWDIAWLRAELGALRRQVQGPQTTTPTPQTPAPPQTSAPEPTAAPDSTTAPAPPTVPGGGADQPIRPGDLADDRDADDRDNVDERDDDRDTESEPPSPGGAPRTPAGPAPSPTAWRRDRARGTSSRPRRRRLR